MRDTLGAARQQAATRSPGSTAASTASSERLDGPRRRSRGHRRRGAQSGRPARPRSGCDGRARGTAVADLRPRAALWRRRGGGHRPWPADGGRGRPVARPRWRARPARCAEAAGLLDEVGRTSADPVGGPDGRRRTSCRRRVASALEALGFRRTEFRVAVTPARRPTAPGASVEIDGETARVRRDRHRRRGLPVRPEPRRAGPAAGPDRLGRRAEPGRPGDQGGPGRSRCDADARLRRDRHRHRRPERRSGRAQPVDARPPPPGPVRDAPAPDRGPCRRPLPDLEARAQRPDRDRGRAARAARARSRSSP